MRPTLPSLTIPGITGPASGLENEPPSLLSALDDPDERSQAKKLSEIARKWFEAHRWYYRESVECLAFYFGNQWGFWSEPAARWVAQPQSRHNDMVRRTCNLTKPMTDAAVALLTRERPIFGAAAVKDSVADTAASVASDAILSYYWRHRRLSDVYRNLARDVITTGTAILLPEWDPSAGAVKTVPTVEMDELGNPTIGSKDVAVGDLTFRLLPRESVAFEPGAETHRSGCAVLVRERMLRSRLKELFPGKLPEIPHGDGNREGTDLRLAQLAEQSSALARGGPSGREEVDMADVFTAYVKKCEKYPRGMMVKFTDDAILYRADNPIYPTKDEPDELWPSSDWPLFVAICDERSMSPWGRGKTVDAIPLQRDINGVLSKTIQHIATIANTKVMVPRAAEVEWDDQIGQILRLGRFDTTNQFGYLTPPPMPQEFLLTFDRLKTEMGYIYGSNEATLGQAPTSDASGRLVQNLQQQDSSRIGPIKANIDDTLSEAMRYGLFLFRRHATEPRQILVAGENSEVELKMLARTDLAAATDVSVLNDQSIPSDPTRRMLWLTQFGQAYNAAPDPNYRRMLLRLARIKDFEGFLVNLDPSESKAQRMIELVLLRQPVYAWPGDDALAMATEIDRFTSRREYELLVRKEKAEEGWSFTESYLSLLYGYYKGVATGAQPPAPPGEVPLPTQPQPPMTMAAPGVATPPMLPPMPQAGGAPDAGATMPEMMAPIPELPSTATPAEPVG